MKLSILFILLCVIAVAVAVPVPVEKTSSEIEDRSFKHKLHHVLHKIAAVAPIVIQAAKDVLPLINMRQLEVEQNQQQQQGEKEEGLGDIMRLLLDTVKQ